MNLKNIVLGLGTATGALLLSVTSSFATTPVADATVVANTTDTINGLQQAALTNLGTLIPIAAVLLISVAVVFFVIRHFRAIVHA